jgi:hypothetical protein
MASVVAAVSLINSTTNSAKYATAAFTPSTGELLVVAIGVAGRTDASADLKDSNGDTYTLVGTYQKDSTSQAYLYVGNFAEAGVAKTLSASFGATATGLLLHIWRVEGMSQFGAAAVLQSKFTNSGTSGTTPRATLGAACTTTNIIIGGVHQNSTTVADPAGWTAGASTSHNTPATRYQSSYRTSGETNSLIAWSGTAASVWSAFVVELDTSAGGPATRTASMSATDAPDTFSASSYVVVSGRMSATDATDIFSSSAKVRVVAAMSATDVFADTFSASANVRVTARLSATETVADTFAATASVRVSASMSATDAADTLSASGYTVVTSRLSATDAADTFLASANVIVSANFSATDAPDIFLASVSTQNNIHASMSATDVADTLVASANVIVSAHLAATDVPDTLSASGYVLVRATVSATDAPDTLSASAQVIVQATMAATDAPDILSASATVQNLFITARLSATDAQDTFLASANVVVSAALSATDAPDVFAASATVIQSAVEVVAPAPSAGHGDKRNDDYQPANDAFWEAREKYLLSLRPEIEVEPGPQIFPEPNGTAEPARVPKLLAELRFERRDAITAVDHARNMRQLRAAGKRLRSVNQRIIAQKQAELAAAKAEVSSLQAELDARREQRARKIARLRRKLVLLEMAHSVLQLQDHL